MSMEGSNGLRGLSHGITVVVSWSSWATAWGQQPLRWVTAGDRAASGILLRPSAIVRRGEPSYGPIMAWASPHVWTTVSDKMGAGHRVIQT